MSLLVDSMEDCIMLDKVTTADGYGGRITTYKEGADFKAAIVLDTSLQAKVAASQGVTGLYTVTTQRSFNLQFHEIFKRLRDNKIFRVTSDGDDKQTPAIATLDMRQVSAEEWKLTEEVETE